MSFGNRGASTDDAVCHAWAHQTIPNMHKNSMFFSGRTIYSYGHHFPIATILKDDDNVVLFTTRDYSAATSAHKWKVKGAVSHKTIIYCTFVPDSSYGTFDKSDHERNIQDWMQQVKNKLNAVAEAKQQRKKDRLMGELPAIQDEARKYIEYFELKLDKAQRQQLFTVDIEGYIEGLRRAEVAAKRKAAAIMKKGKELHPVWLEAWRNCKDTAFWQDKPYELRKAIEAVEYADDNRNKVRLRIQKWFTDETEWAEVSTSKGIHMKVDIAHRYYRKYLAVVAKGGCSETCNYKMLDYPVTEMNADHLLVGCHDIARSEIDYIAEKLGWSIPSALNNYIDTLSKEQ